MNVGYDFKFEIQQDCQIDLKDNDPERLKKKYIERENPVKLLHFQSKKSIIWVSLSALDHKNPQENFIKIGYGDLLKNNLLAHYVQQKTEVFESLRSITIDLVIFNKPAVKVIEKTCLITPFVGDYCPLVIDESLPRTATQFSNNYMAKTIVHLKEQHPKIESLYSDAKAFLLKKEVSEAIHYSCSTPGKKLNQFLKENRKSYIRVPVASESNAGDQPGQRLVIEIWPAGNSSSIHNHGNCVAIIKVLVGEITVNFYNSFEIRNNQTPSKEPMPIKSVDLKVDDITWMMPFFHQTHKLTNKGKSTAITLQAYSHTDVNTDGTKEEYFEYLDPKSMHREEFIPNQDFSYKELRETVLSEYKK